MINLSSERLKQQLEFLYEIDKLKTVFRKTNLIFDPERLENTAEHSWHLAFYVMILAEHANETIDIMHVMKMVLLHDIVEIDAGDSFAFDEVAAKTKEAREQAAAERIFGLLPPDQGKEFMAIWREFEAGETPDARFAISVDRIQPLFHNYLTGGGSWKRHDIKRAQVEKRMAPIGNGSATLADIVNQVLDDSVKTGILRQT